MIFIAAELGVNWRNLTEARRMIGLAKNAGADAIKLQIYKPEHVKGHPRQQELEEIILDPERIKSLKQVADDCGIEFFATPYYPEAVEMLEAVGVKRYKIRYADRHNITLINEIISTEKPYLISCGWEYVCDSTPDSMPEEIWHTGPEKRIFVFCVPEYPPKIVEIPHTFQEYLILFHGFSSHYSSITPPLVAAARGCEYIEVHVKQDKYPDGYKPIDDAVSITFSQLAELCRLVREIEKIEW